MLWLKIRSNKRSDRTIYHIQNGGSVRKRNYSKKCLIVADQMLSHVTKKMVLMALASSWTRNRACHTPELFCGISKGLCGKNFPCWEFGKAASSSRGSGGMQGQHTLRYFPKQISLPPALPWEWDVIHSWVCSNCAFMSN